MLGLLFGSKTVEKVLLFLFVNGKCYGTYLHQFLGIPLNPIQKALIRLEKSGVIISHYEGKTRLYEFNPYFPLASEIENLVKKSYFLLSVEERKSLYAPDVSVSKSCFLKNKNEVIFSFWDRLSKIKYLLVRVKNKHKDQEEVNRVGQCEVVVQKESNSSIIFFEKGSWVNSEGDSSKFTNIFRWILNNNGMIGLEHLRRGLEYPVVLCYLSPTGKKALSSIDSFLNHKNNVFGHIRFDDRSFCFHWRIIDSEKDEKIEYYYS